MAWELVDGQLSSVQRWRGLNEPTGHHIRYFNYRRRHYAALETADRVRGRAGIDDVLSSSMCSYCAACTPWQLLLIMKYYK